MTGPRYTEAAIRARLARLDGAFPRVGDGVTERINLLEAFAELCAVSVARADYYGRLLAEQIERASGTRDVDEPSRVGWPGPTGAGGLIGYTLATNVTGPVANQEIEVTPTGEEVRALVKLEAEERDRAARLIKDALKVGISLQQVEVIRSYAGTVAAALHTVTAELGFTMDDDIVQRAAKRAALAARRALGEDDGDPDVHAGPALTAVERVRILREALARAEQRAALDGGADR